MPSLTITSPRMVQMKLLQGKKVELKEHVNTLSEAVQYLLEKKRRRSILHVVFPVYHMNATPTNSRGRIKLEFVGGRWVFVIYVSGKRVGAFNMATIDSREEKEKKKIKKEITKETASVLAASKMMAE